MRKPRYNRELVEKIKHQLEELARPPKRKRQSRSLTVKDYEKMDPFWMSTMGGRFAGRVIKQAGQAKGGGGDE